MVFKHQLKPLTKGGQTVVHAGKGSQQADMPSRKSVKALHTPPTNDINNYAKNTPMAQGTSAPDGNLASGDWPGIGQ